MFEVYLVPLSFNSNILERTSPFDNHLNHQAIEWGPLVPQQWFFLSTFGLFIIFANGFVNLLIGYLLTVSTNRVICAHDVIFLFFIYSWGPLKPHSICHIQYYSVKHCSVLIVYKDVKVHIVYDFTTYC